MTEEAPNTLLDRPDSGLHSNLLQVRQKERTVEITQNVLLVRHASGGGMNIKTLQRGLKYIDRVTAIRQTYHVFEAHDYYFVLSFALSKARRGSGYFNVIARQAVDYVQERFGGTRGVTAKDVVTAARRTRHIPTRLTALNILYILVALGSAGIARAGENRQLFFTVKKRRE